MLALCVLSTAAAAIEPASVAEPAEPSAALPEFLDSERLHSLEDAWRRGTVTEGQTDVPKARSRAEELSGRFSAGDKPQQSGADAPKQWIPSDLSEAAMPRDNPVLSRVGAAPPAEPPTDDTTTATIPDPATPELQDTPAQDSLAVQNGSPDTAKGAAATWQRHGIPPLPVRKSAKLKPSKSGDKAKAAKSDDKAGKKAEKPDKAEKAEKKAEVKVIEAEEEKPVKQYRPIADASPPKPRADPARREVFPPYLGAYGMTK
jgi:hypothetical protein